LSFLHHACETAITTYVAGAVESPCRLHYRLGEALSRLSYGRTSMLSDGHCSSIFSTTSPGLLINVPNLPDIGLGDSISMCG